MMLCFVFKHYEEEEEAKAAVNALHNTEFHGSVLSVEVCIHVPFYLVFFF